MWRRSLVITTIVEWISPGVTADALVGGWDEARAVGLHGNDREADSASERARVSVTPGRQGGSRPHR